MIKSDSQPTWQKQIIEQVDARVCSLYIAEDPDCLLAEETLQKALQENGFQLYFYEDSIELRHFLLTQLSVGFAGCVVSIDSDNHEIDALPYDILSQAQRLSVSLGDCFPDLSYEVLKSLQTEELNALDAAFQEYTPGQMGETSSSDFVLRHVFKLAPEVIQTPSDLLKNLLSLHLRDVELPDILKRRLIALLANREQFLAWPLTDIVSSKQGLFELLQEHWPSYLETVVEGRNQATEVQQRVYPHSRNEEKSLELPFGHDDVRVYIDDLFLEGLLKPIELESPEKLAGHWALVGVQQEHGKELWKRINGLLKLCDESIPLVTDRHQQWQQYAYRWAELSACFHANFNTLKKNKNVVHSFENLQLRVDKRFSDWMLEKFTGLHNYPPMPPVMLHHIPRAMAREIDDETTSKTALILIDGLAIDQWVTLKTHLNLGYSFDESAVFAWVPTITSVSRQALFSAKAPYQFAKSIATTSAEPRAWEQFWLDHGLAKHQVFYKKSLGTDQIDHLIDELSDRRLRAVGLVINTVDDMMHGMQLGAAGMHNQVKLWAESGYLKQLIDALASSGFSIHITSDHGNVESTGTGKITEAGIARSRGERARVYESETLRDSLDFDFNQVAKWPQSGLPNDYWAVVMKGRKAFVAKDDKIVAHGGITIEEVVVPYITIK